jgi:hypothetical protein
VTPRRRRWLRIGTRLALLALAAVVAALGGPYLACRSRPVSLNAAASPSPGHLIHVVGWNGPVGGDADFLNALRDAGCRQSMEAFDWTAGRRGLFALWRSQHSDEPSRQLAARIEQLAREDRTRPLYLTADSSGCGVALAALARLSEDVQVERVILSSPAVSRGYDLAPALRHVRGSIVSFNSTRDDLILGLGTTIFGTTDGRHAGAAGRDGFVRNADAKLEQVPYDAAWNAAYGHDGLHARALSPRFARALVAPRLMQGPTSKPAS